MRAAQTRQDAEKNQKLDTAAGQLVPSNTSSSLHSLYVASTVDADTGSAIARSIPTMDPIAGKIREMETMHTLEKLDHWLSEYYDFHKRSIESIGFKPDAQKFLVFQMLPVGMGNNLLALISAFLAAIVMNRVFVIDFEIDASRPHLACRVKNSPDRCVDKYGGGVDDVLAPPGGIEWNYRTVLRKLRYSATDVGKRSPTVFIGYPGRHILDSLTCGDYSKDFPQQFLLLKANTYLLPHIYHNPHYHAALKPLLGVNPFRRLAQRIFRFRPALQRLLDRAPTLPKPLVCAHIRLASARWEHVNSNRAVARHLECLDDLVKLHSAASVYIAMMPPLRQKFGDWIASRFKNRSVRIHFHTPETGTPLLDDLVELLRMLPCDEIVGTHSTITEFAAGLQQNATPPHLILGSQPKKCEKALTAEPCVMHWRHVPKLSCGARLRSGGEDVNSSTKGCWPYHDVSMRHDTPIHQLPGYMSRKLSTLVFRLPWQGVGRLEHRALR